MNCRLKKWKNGVTGRFETDDPKKKAAIEKDLRKLAKKHGCAEPSVFTLEDSPLPECPPSDPNCGS